MSDNTTHYTEVYNKPLSTRGYLDNYVTMLFKRGVKQRALAFSILNCITKSEERQLDVKSLYTSVSQTDKINRVTFYKTLHRLKEFGLIRKQWKAYRLDSSFSLGLIRIASDFIMYGGIKSAEQKEEVKNIIAMLMGFE